MQYDDAPAPPGPVASGSGSAAAGAAAAPVQKWRIHFAKPPSSAAVVALAKPVTTATLVQNLELDEEAVSFFFSLKSRFFIIARTVLIRIVSSHHRREIPSSSMFLETSVQTGQRSDFLLLRSLSSRPKGTLRLYICEPFGLAFLYDPILLESPEATYVVEWCELKVSHNTKAQIASAKERHTELHTFVYAPRRVRPPFRWPVMRSVS